MEKDSNSQTNAGEPRKGVQVAVNTAAMVLAGTGCILATFACMKQADDTPTCVQVTKTDNKPTYDGNVKKILEELRAESQKYSKRMEEAEKLLSEIRKEITRYETLVQKLSDSQGKSDSYLAAAKEARARGEKTADILYASALRYAPEKMAILKDYVAWKQEEISIVLRDGSMQSLETARERLSLLKVFCDTVLEDASPQDIRSVNELLDMLAQSDCALVAAEKTLEDNQRNELKQVAGVLSTAARQQLDNYAGRWGDGSVVPALEELRDEVFSSIQQWRSCCTSTEESLMLPELAGITDEILEKWLTNFKVRMETADIDWEKRQEDWDAAEEVLELAAEKKEGNIKTLFDELNAIERQEMSKQWIKLAETAEDEYAIDDLLSRVHDLDPGLIKNGHRALLCKAYDKRISRYNEELRNIMNKISDEEIKNSFISGITTQCWQLELEILAAQEKYQFGEFKTQLDNVRKLRKGEQVQTAASAPVAPPQNDADKKAYYESRLNELSAMLKTHVTEKTVRDISDFAEKELEPEIRSCADPNLRRELEALQDQARLLVTAWARKVRL